MSFNSQTNSIIYTTKSKLHKSDFFHLKVCNLYHILFSKILNILLRGLYHILQKYETINYQFTINHLLKKPPASTGGLNYSILDIFVPFKILINITPTIKPATPCTAFAGIFTSDGINPYKNPSNT